MLKRVKYISRFAQSLDDEDIEDIVQQSARNNAELEVTGVLMASGKMFFQILEGPPEHVDLVYRNIVRDDRHVDVLLINSEEDLQYRLFPEWPMKMVDLGIETDVQRDSLRLILETVIESRTHLEKLMGALERAIWNEVSTEEEPAEKAASA
jgi:hypothetical protein